MSQSIQVIMMERRIDVWKARQIRRFSNYTMKADRFVSRHKMKFLLACAGFVAINALAFYQVRKQVSTSESAAEKNHASGIVVYPVAQSPPDFFESAPIPDSNSEQADEEKVKLRLSYELMQTVAQSVSERE